jgi:hypothetical protein
MPHSIPFSGVGPALRRTQESINYPMFARRDFRDPDTREVTQEIEVLGYVDTWAVYQRDGARPTDTPLCCPRSEIFRTNNNDKRK